MWGKVRCNVLIAVMVPVGFDGLILCVSVVVALPYILMRSMLLQEPSRERRSQVKLVTKNAGKSIYRSFANAVFTAMSLSHLWRDGSGGNTSWEMMAKLVFCIFMSDKGNILLLLYLHEAGSLSLSLSLSLWARHEDSNDTLHFFLLRFTRSAGMSLYCQQHHHLQRVVRIREQPLLLDWIASVQSATSPLL